jgi:hypothetical protein
VTTIIRPKVFVDLRGTSLTIGTSGTVLEFQEVLEDNYGAYDTTTGIITIPKGHGGLYFGVATYLVALTLTTAQYAQIYISGGGITQYNRRSGNGVSTNHCPLVETILRLEEGDTVYCGGNASVAGTTNATNYWNQFKLVQLS